MHFHTAMGHDHGPIDGTFICVLSRGFHRAFIADFHRVPTVLL